MINEFTPRSLQYIRSDLKYKAPLSRQLNCWSLRCSSIIACRRCSNYIFILDFTLASVDLTKTTVRRNETLIFWIWCSLEFRQYSITRPVRARYLAVCCDSKTSLINVHSLIVICYIVMHCTALSQWLLATGIAWRSGMDPVLDTHSLHAYLCSNW